MLAIQEEVEKEKIKTVDKASEKEIIGNVRN